MGLFYQGLFYMTRNCGEDTGEVSYGEDTGLGEVTYLQFIVNYYQQKETSCSAASFAFSLDAVYFYSL